MRPELNPYKRERLALKVTQEQVAEACDITRLAVIRNEQGLFEQPLPAITTCRVFDFSGLEDEYTKWVISQRALLQLELLEVSISGSISPFEQLCREWFSSRSRQSFARGLLVHPVSLVGYCDGTQAKLPNQIGQALKQAGLKYLDIEYLQDEQYEWGEAKRGAGK